MAWPNTARILLTLFAVVSASNALDRTVTLGSPNDDDEVIYAGVAEGKVFWAVVESPFMNWTTARDGCSRRNMKFAEITSAEQAQVIRSTYQQSQYTCCSYWVAARDSKMPRQFSWDESNTDVSSSGVNLAGPVNIHGCLYIRVDTGELYYRECDNPSIRAYMCEITLPSD